MLPKKNRLTDRADFQEIYKNGRFFSLNSIAIQFLPNNTKETRVGFSVGKKYLKKATERNKARRILREIISTELSRINTGIDIIISLRSKKNTLNNLEMKKDVTEILKKCNLFI